MTVNELMTQCGFEAVCLPDSEREVSGAYIGDLLSWVMGRAQEDNAWVTIMSNINVIAVASLSDVACVILAEGVTLDDELKSTAEQKGINVLKTDLPAFETAQKLIGNV
ncbi:MAG: hypothetical protein E7571_05845 [Ruminococcaceae bacterium]|jgi:predicted transcriptional regulator|nr:hypothetical protein [Oscillospiraceae bacterium]